MELNNRITNDIYFVTDTVVEWVDIFTRPVYKHIIIESLSYCQRNKGLIIYAWVLMSNHLHAIIGSDGEESVSEIWRDFKKYTCKEIIDAIRSSPTESRREWLLHCFRHAGTYHRKVIAYKLWQDGNNAVAIFSDSFFEQKLNYIHSNPVVAEYVNLPEDYRYSSAIDYAGGKGLLDVVVV